MGDSSTSEQSETFSSGSALAAVGAGVWEWDFATRRVRSDPRASALFGLEPINFDGGLEALFQRVDSADYARLRTAVHVGVAGREPFALEMRFRQPDGSNRWVEVRGRVHADDTGEPVSVVGVAMDAVFGRGIDRNLSTGARAVSEATPVPGEPGPADVDQEELVEDLQASVVRGRSLQAFTTALGAGMTLKEIGDIVIDQAKEQLGALFTAMLVYAEDGRSVRFIRMNPLPGPVVEGFARVSADWSVPVFEAVNRRMPHVSRHLGLLRRGLPPPGALGRALRGSGLRRPAPDRRRAAGRGHHRVLGRRTAATHRGASVPRSPWPPRSPRPWSGPRPSSSSTGWRPSCSRPSSRPSSRMCPGLKLAARYLSCRGGRRRGRRLV